MRIHLLIAALIVSLSSFSQSDFLIGRQEFPTAIMGQASDAQGNMYYTGYFKGQLKVNNQMLSNGAGQEDIFWVKTNASGQVIRHFTFGSQYTDVTIQDGLVMSPEQKLYMIAKGPAGLSFGGIALQPYPDPGGIGFANGIIKFDTSGAVKWVRRTNLNLLRIHASQGLIHVIGTISPNLGAIKFENDMILDSLGKIGLVYMVLDTNGQFLGRKTILGRTQNQGPTLMDMKTYSDGSLLFSMRMIGDSSFLLNGVSVPIPNINNGYQLVIKTDTSFTYSRTRILNPNNQTIYGIGSSSLPQTLAPSDSLYLILSYEGGAALSIDGYSVPFNKNTLLVMDSSLTVRRMAILGSSFIAPYAPNIGKRKIYFRNVQISGNQLYFTGQFVGINESPMNVVQPRDTLIPVIGNVLATVDLNGSSKSFVARTNLGITSSNMKWIGDHKEYETSNLGLNYLHKVNDNRLFFMHPADNVWNPWVIDTSLTVLQGSMRRNADRPEIPQMISFFGDGSRLVITYAQGNTALDSNLVVPCNVQRRDLFLSCFNTNGSVRWYHRIQTTLNQPFMRKLVVKNGKAWMFASLSGNQNDSNFIRINNQLYDVRVNANLVASIDSAGNINQINLGPSGYKYGSIVDISFFSNGDLAILCNQNVPITLPGAPTSSGIFLLRVNPATGAIIDGRKMTGSMIPNISTLVIDQSNTIYIAGNVPFSQTPTSSFYLGNGISTIDSVTISSNPIGVQHAFLLKLEWNDLQWFKRFSGAAGASLRGYGDLFLVNDRPVIMVNSQISNQPLLWNNQMVHNAAYGGKTTIVGMDSSGNLVRWKHIPVLNRIYSRKGSGEKLYLSGSIISSLQLDTIQVSNAGLTDALSLVLDSSLIAKRSFRLASPLNEAMFDMDIYRDSLAAFAYTAQTTPQLFLNRGMVQDSDYEEDAFITTKVLGTGVITATPDILPDGNAVMVSPNPVQDNMLRLRIQSKKNLESVCMIYTATGQWVKSVVMSVKQGERSYEVSLPAAMPKGVYYVNVVNKDWGVTKRFVR